MGGLAGTWAMNHAQRAWSRAVNDAPPESAAGKHDARDWQERDDGENANELAAQAVARLLLGHTLKGEELAVAASLVHFMFGAAVGGLYGALTKEARAYRLKSGVALGLALWLIADELAMPLLGLSKSTTRRPAEMHVQSFTAHMVYGVVTEFIRQRTESRL